MNDRSTNKHGLDRSIPADVKREVRRRSKLGCIFCRGLICDYEHIEPTFSEATKHDPDGICLLCPQHHRDVTHRRITKAQVMERYRTIQNDPNIQPPYYQTTLTGSLALELGRSKFDHLPEGFAVIRYDGEDVLKVGYVADDLFGGVRPSISGTVADAKGNPILAIEDNIITVAKTVFDAEFVGPVLTLRAGRGLILADVEVLPPNGLRIQRLQMRHRHLTLNLHGTFGAIADMPGNVQVAWELPDIEASGCNAAVAFTPDTSQWVDGIHLVGGVGVQVPGGITMAAGMGTGTIKRLTGQLVMPQRRRAARQ